MSDVLRACHLRSEAVGSEVALTVSCDAVTVYISSLLHYHMPTAWRMHGADHDVRCVLSQSACPLVDLTDT